MNEYASFLQADLPELTKTLKRYASGSSPGVRYALGTLCLGPENAPSFRKSYGKFIRACLEALDGERIIDISLTCDGNGGATFEATLSPIPVGKCPRCGESSHELT